MLEKYDCFHNLNLNIKLIRINLSFKKVEYITLFTILFNLGKINERKFRL
jgi:hypothetical protein